MYIVLGKYTDEGVKNIRTMRQFHEENLRQGEQLGLKPHGFYLTMGRYDFVVVGEGPDDETIVAQVLGTTSRGRTRTETLRGFTLDEADRIIQRLS